MTMTLRMGLATGAIAISLSVFSPATAQSQPSLEQAITAFDAINAQSERKEIWSCLSQLSDATEALENHTPKRTDPQQEALQALAEDHLSDLVSAYGKFDALRFYLMPLVEEEILRNGGPHLSRIDAITLPENATEDQAWVFIRDIVRASEGQRRISSGDPQSEKLAELCKDHMHLLIKALDMPRIQYYATVAIREHADDSHRRVIIDAMLQQQELIVIVQRRGWAEHAKAQLVEGLEQGVEYSPRMWMQCLAGLEDPETYHALALQLYRERCSRGTYMIVSDLPGINLRPVVLAAWEDVHNSPTHARELREVSQIAVEYGHLEALSHLISLLSESPLTHRSRAAEVRRTIFEHIDFEGTDDELKDWFDQNKANLRFSPTRKSFYVSGGLS